MSIDQAARGRIVPQFSQPSCDSMFIWWHNVIQRLGSFRGGASANSDLSRLLEPKYAIGRIGGGSYSWRSESNDPQFELNKARSALGPGWWAVELCVRTNASECAAKFYFGYGDNFSEANAINLPFRNGVLAYRLFYLTGVPKAIRFDPLECVGDFSVEKLRFVPVRPIAARNQMLRSLTTGHQRYRDQRISLIWRELQKRAEAENTTVGAMLYGLYRGMQYMKTVSNRRQYARWIDTFEGVESLGASAARSAEAAPEYGLTVSVVIPTYNTPEGFLRQAIESVLKQSYPLWELCIADDGSTEPNVRLLLQEYSRRDSRVKVTFRPENGHICAASNSALSLATGEYVALLDHDDTLARHALHAVVKAIYNNPGVQIIYSDEDKIDEVGNRSDPHFKPDWNPDLFLSQNYIAHLVVYRRELVNRIGGFREGLEGSQDHDLLLRCLRHVNDSEIVHVPSVLYHWRMVQGSTALASQEKDYTTSAGVKALRDFFVAQDRLDVGVEAGFLPNTYRVRYPIPQPEPLVTILIPTKDKLEFLEPCVRSILERTTYKTYEIIVLDNESSEPETLEFLGHISREDQRVRILQYHHPFNFPAINNYGVHHARGAFVALVNNDTEVISPDWLTEMIGHAIRPGIGCVGAKLYYDDDTIQHAGVILGIGGVAGHGHKYFPRHAHGYFSRLRLCQNLSAVTAACLVVRKAIYDQVGGMDENELTIAFNDVDFCLKVREAGYLNLWTPYAELYHHESQTRGKEDTPEKIARSNREIAFMKAKWGEKLLRDPYYSRNLTLEKEDFSLARLH